MAQFEDDWQSKYGAAKERGLHLLRTGSWSDCKFLVGQQSKVYFHAHKLILASASRVFEAMFYGGMAETREVIDITDIQPEPFKAMLEYIYGDIIKVKTFDEACSLYFCADKYNLKHLAEGCIKFIAAKLKPDNACQIYEFAKMFNEYDLMHKTVQVMQVHTSDILKSDSFLSAEVTTVVEILSHSILNFNSELELFEAAERYANAYGEVKSNIRGSRKRKLPLDDPMTDESEVEKTDNEGNEPSPSDSTSDSKSNISQENAVVIDEKKKEVFRTIRSKILFLTIPPQQFADRISQSPYLTQSECYGLLMNIVSDNTNVPVPDGFSTQRRARYKLIADPKCYADLSIDKTPTRNEAIFTLTVAKFKKLKQMSMPFYIRNLSWRVAVDPQVNINDPKQKVLGIHLVISPMALKQNITCATDIEIGLAMLKKTNAHRILKKTSHVFSPKSKSIGAVVSLTDEMFDPNNGYVRNNAIKITINIKTGEITGI